MRLQTTRWTVSGAVKTGHYHLYKGTNCQDAMGFYAVDLSSLRNAQLTTTPDFLCGVVSDGCGEGEHSEVGSQMLVAFVLSEIRRIRSRQVTSLQDIAKQLFHSVVRYIDLNLHLSCPTETPAEIAAYVRDYWLATLLGFLICGDEGLIFYAGDGEFALGDVVTVIDQQNTPHYLAYACLRAPQEVGVSADFIPREFMTVPFDASKVKSVRISSDGFSTKNEARYALAVDRERSLPIFLAGHERGHRGDFGLKKWMNSRSDRGYFEDDCAIVVAERL